MLRYFSLDIICSSVFLELRRGNSLLGRDMSADKYPSIFPHQMEDILLVCYSYELVYYSYVLVCYSYALVCYSYVLICTRIMFQSRSLEYVV